MEGNTNTNKKIFTTLEAIRKKAARGKSDPKSMAEHFGSSISEFADRNPSMPNSSIAHVEDIPIESSPLIEESINGSSSSSSSSSSNEEEEEWHVDQSNHDESNFDIMPQHTESEESQDIDICEEELDGYSEDPIEYIEESDDSENSEDNNVDTITIRSNNKRKRNSRKKKKKKKKKMKRKRKLKRVLETETSILEEEIKIWKEPIISEAPIVNSAQPLRSYGFKEIPPMYLDGWRQIDKKRVVIAFEVPKSAFTESSTMLPMQQFMTPQQMANLSISKMKRSNHSSEEHYYTKLTLMMLSRICTLGSEPTKDMTRDDTTFRRGSQLSKKIILDNGTTRTISPDDILTTKDGKKSVRYEKGFCRHPAYSSMLIQSGRVSSFRIVVDQVLSQRKKVFTYPSNYQDGYGDDAPINVDNESISVDTSESESDIECENDGYESPSTHYTREELEEIGEIASDDQHEEMELEEIVPSPTIRNKHKRNKKRRTNNNIEEEEEEEEEQDKFLPLKTIEVTQSTIKRNILHIPQISITWETLSNNKFETMGYRLWIIQNDPAINLGSNLDILLRDNQLRNTSSSFIRQSSMDSCNCYGRISDEVYRQRIARTSGVLGKLHPAWSVPMTEVMLPLYEYENNPMHPAHLFHPFYIVAKNDKVPGVCPAQRNVKNYFDCDTGGKHGPIISIDDINSYFEDTDILRNAIRDLPSFKECFPFKEFINAPSSESLKPSLLWTNNLPKDILVRAEKNHILASNLREISMEIRQSPFVNASHPDVISSIRLNMALSDNIGLQTGFTDIGDDPITYDWDEFIERAREISERVLRGEDIDEYDTLRDTYSQRKTRLDPLAFLNLPEKLKAKFYEEDELLAFRAHAIEVRSNIRKENFSTDKAYCKVIEEVKIEMLNDIEKIEQDALTALGESPSSLIKLPKTYLAGLRWEQGFTNEELWPEASQCIEKSNAGNVMDTWTCFIVHIYDSLSEIFMLNEGEAQHLAFRIMLCRNSALSEDSKGINAYNQLLSGIGGVGKSYPVECITEISAPEHANVITDITMKAFATEQSRCYEWIVLHECPPSIFSGSGSDKNNKRGGGSDNGGDAIFKNILTSGFSKTEMCQIEKDPITGKTTKANVVTGSRAKVSATIITNNDLNNLSDALRQRLCIESIAIDDSKTSPSDIADEVNVSWIRRKDEIRDAQKKRLAYFTNWLPHKLERRIGVFEDVNMDVWNLLMPAYCKFVQEKYSVTIKVRTKKQMRNATRSAVIIYAIYAHFMSEVGRTKGLNKYSEFDRLRSKDFYGIEKHMILTEGMFITMMSLFHKIYLPLVECEIMKALVKSISGRSVIHPPLVDKTSSITMHDYEVIFDSLRNGGRISPINGNMIDLQPTIQSGIINQSSSQIAITDGNRNREEEEEEEEEETIVSNRSDIDIPTRRMRAGSRLFAIPSTDAVSSFQRNLANRQSSFTSSISGSSTSRLYQGIRRNDNEDEIGGLHELHDLSYVTDNNDDDNTDYERRLRRTQQIAHEEIVRADTQELSRASCVSNDINNPIRLEDKNYIFLAKGMGDILSMIKNEMNNGYPDSLLFSVLKGFSKKTLNVRDMNSDGRKSIISRKVISFLTIPHTKYNSGGYGSSRSNNHGSGGYYLNIPSAYEHFTSFDITNDLKEFVEKDISFITTYITCVPYNNEKGFLSILKTIDIVPNPSKVFSRNNPMPPLPSYNATVHNNSGTGQTIQALESLSSHDVDVHPDYLAIFKHYNECGFPITRDFTINVHFMINHPIGLAVQCARYRKKHYAHYRDYCPIKVYPKDRIDEIKLINKVEEYKKDLMKKVKNNQLTARQYHDKVRDTSISKLIAMRSRPVNQEDGFTNEEMRIIQNLPRIKTASSYNSFAITGSSSLSHSSTSLLESSRSTSSYNPLTDDLACLFEESADIINNMVTSELDRSYLSRSGSNNNGDNINGSHYSSFISENARLSASNDEQQQNQRFNSSQRSINSSSSSSSSLSFSMLDTSVDSLAAPYINERTRQLSSSCVNKSMSEINTLSKTGFVSIGPFKMYSYGNSSLISDDNNEEGEGSFLSHAPYRAFSQFSQENL